MSARADAPAGSGARAGPSARPLAYVLWHWKRAEVPAADYEARQRAFHAALAASPPAGFLGSFSVGLSGAPWAAGGAEAYEDWYLVRDFAALGLLNEAAVTASRAAPHDAAAAVAGGGSAGLFRLRLGTELREPGHAHWFAKPAGEPYAGLLEEMEPLVAAAGGCLWMRQMTLGPATELCLHAPRRVELPARLQARTLPLRAAWPALPAGVRAIGGGAA